jgi:cytochrome c2
MSRTSVIVAVLALASVIRSPAHAQDAAAGKSMFRSQCSICHSVEPGRNMTGPSLFAIVGRPAGQVSGFHYSPAMQTSHFTWDKATLDRYLAAPRQVVPGTFMAYAGVKDATQRANLIAYLAATH